MTTLALDERSFERILLIKPSAVGDVIHTLPIITKLRARYPAARIDWLLTPAIAELVGRHPALSNVVLFDRQAYAQCWRSPSATGKLLRLLTTIRQARYELVIDLHGQFRSAVLTLASGAPVRIGFDRPRRSIRRATARQLPRGAYRHGWTGAREGSWLAYSHVIPLPTLDVHAIERYLWLGSLLGLDQRPPEFQLSIPSAARARVDQLLSPHHCAGSPLAVLVPGTIWPTKQWQVEGFAAVAQYLEQKGWTAVLAGAPNERARNQAVAQRCQRVIDLTGQTTLSELAALIGRADLCVTNDSGSMHLTVALGRPVVSIFGPTDPVWIGPYRRPEAVVRANLACAPCYLRSLRACPFGHACMKQVTASMVIQRIEQILAQWHTTAG